MASCLFGGKELRDVVLHLAESLTDLFLAVFLNLVLGAGKENWHAEVIIHHPQRPILTHRKNPAASHRTVLEVPELCPLNLWFAPILLYKMMHPAHLIKVQGRGGRCLQEVSKGSVQQGTNKAE